ncbi:MAG: HAD-IIB family hydrolase [Marinobacter sp.]|uniref:HAD-IIB family hydrolase n=1 Tax=Marinobacter sp. TaxID=50741 RepID=UPI00299DDAE5|nr:HAD-IIB family hydrolase [Marinobacter sp.]MDX1754680.1 HAD-IIB family hydrolase [Marinobacter sp.]
MRLIVISDLDGTLLDHTTYSWSAATPALERLSGAGIPVVLNSSKTIPEIRAIREELSNSAPFIAENGAALVIPRDYFMAAPEQVELFGADHPRILRVLAGLRQRGFRFRSFQDMTTAELTELTGLDPDAAVRAKQRAGTEPLLWQGSDAALEEFEEALMDCNLRLLAGGRFLHVMGRFDKADGVRYIARAFRSQYPGERVVTVALGDSPNDQAMLEAVDVPVIIRGPRSDSLSLPSDRHVMRSLKEGPAGWNECMLNLLMEFGY